MIALAVLHPCQAFDGQIAIGWGGKLGHRSFLSPDRAIIFLVGSGQIRLLWTPSPPKHLHFRFGFGISLSLAALLYAYSKIAVWFSWSLPSTRYPRRSFYSYRKPIHSFGSPPN